MWDAIRSALIWGGIALCTLVYFPLCMITALAALPFDRRRATAHFWASAWARTSTWLTGWRCEVDRATLAPGRHFVVVSNHESLADIMALLHLGVNFKWISKESVFKVPMLGWSMHLAGYIPLRRGDRSSIKRCMALARGWLDAGVSVALFPEGTRSLDGEIKPFKPGAFRLAWESGVDLLPIAITGTRDSLRKHSWKFADKVTMRVLCGEPIPIAGVREEDLPELAERTREIVHGLRDRLLGREAPAEPVRRRAAAR